MLAVCLVARKPQSVQEYVIIEGADKEREDVDIVETNCVARPADVTRRRERVEEPYRASPDALNQAAPFLILARHMLFCQRPKRRLRA